MNCVISIHVLVPCHNVVIITLSGVSALMDATDTESYGLYTCHPRFLSTQLLNFRCHELNDDSSMNMNQYPCLIMPHIMALNTCQLVTTSDRVVWMGHISGHHHAMLSQFFISCHNFSRLGIVSLGCYDHIHASSDLMVTGVPHMDMSADSTMSHHLFSHASHS